MPSSGCPREMKSMASLCQGFVLFCFTHTHTSFSFYSTVSLHIYYGFKGFKIFFFLLFFMGFLRVWMSGSLLLYLFLVPLG